MNTQAEKTIPSSIQAVLDLFESELADLKFPDLDRQVLGESASSVLKLAEAQARAEAALQAAREALAEGQEQLLHKCQRALAYARVYAEDNGELLGRLDGIELPRSGRSGRSTTPPPSGEARGAARRSRRGSPPSGPLFLEPAPAALGDDGAQGGVEPAGERDAA